METLWIARDKNNFLWIYQSKPHINEDGNAFAPDHKDWESYMRINSNHFPEVTFENSPKEFELKVLLNETAE